MRGSGIVWLPLNLNTEENCSKLWKSVLVTSVNCCRLNVSSAAVCSVTSVEECVSY